MNISVIIPTYNEEAFIGDTIQAIKQRAADKASLQIIVADGGSDDTTVEKAKEAGATVIHVEMKRRSVQLNKGTQAETGSVLYFIHADTLPPKHFDKLIIETVNRGKPAGCFRLSFDYNHFLLRFYSWCTRFDVDAFRYGDQSLFIQKDIFQRIGGFKEDHQYMEDNEIIKRIKREQGSFTILSQSVITSSRKYLRNGVVRLQAIFILIYLLYRLGTRQSVLHWLYHKLIH